MTKSQRPLVLLAAVALAACASSSAEPAPAAVPAETPQQEAPPPAATQQTTAPAAPSGSSTLTFSAVQSDRGRNVFRTSCTECHYSNEFSDQQFKFKWRRRSAGDLFNHISTTMPEDAPGSLPAQQYADLVAYILRVNGVEPGSGELPADGEALKALSLSVISGS